MVECVKCKNQFIFILSYDLCYKCWPNYIWTKILTSSRKREFSIETYILPERREIALNFIVKYHNAWSDYNTKQEEREIAWSEVITDRSIKAAFIEKSVCYRAFALLHKQVSIQPIFHFSFMSEYVLCNRPDSNFIRVRNQYDRLSDNLNSPKIRMCEYELHAALEHINEILKNRPYEFQNYQMGTDGRECCFICQKPIFFERRSITTNICKHRFHSACLGKYLATPQNSIDVIHGPKPKGCPECGTEIKPIHSYEHSQVTTRSLTHPSNSNGNDCAFV